MGRTSGRYVDPYLRFLAWVGRHRPLAAGALLVILLQLWRAASALEPSSGSQTVWDWVVLASVASAGISTLVVLPRLVRRTTALTPMTTYLAMGFAFAAAPFLIAFSAYLSGAHAWVMPVALCSTMALFVLTLFRAPS